MTDTEYVPTWTHNGFMFDFIPVKFDFSDMESVEINGPIVQGRWVWADWLLSGVEVILSFLINFHPNPENIEFEFKITECIHADYDHLFTEEEE
jgi:hypothetical protein